MSSEWFSVYVETRAPAGAAAFCDDAALDRLMDLLEEHAGVVSAAATSWSATISIHAQGAAQAVSSGVRLIDKMSVKAGMPLWPQTRTEAVRQDVLEVQNERQTMPDLVSAPEAAEILGVSSQRVHELARAGWGFPLPVYELKVGKLWLRAAIEAYAERRERRPGRPDKAALLREKVTSALYDCGMTTTDASVTLSGDRRVVLQISSRSPRSGRRWVQKVINALSSCGLAVMPDVGEATNDLEAYLADGHPVMVVELQDAAADVSQGPVRIGE